MAALRISAALILISTTLALPQDPSAHLSVTVIDRTGAAIAGAEIAMDGQLKASTKADTKGEATLAMVPGKHNLSIKARVFKPWSREIELDGNTNQSVVAVLDVDCERSTCDVIVTSNELSAQTARQVPLNVTVTDQSGAPVAHALVHARPDDSTSPIEVQADARGVAALSLPSGPYIVSVNAPSFRTWRSTINLTAAQSITAELLISAPGSGFVINEEKTIQTERPIFDVSIPLEPLESLIDWPAHKVRRFGRSHHKQS